MYEIKIASSFEDVKKQTIAQNGFHQCTEELYFQALESLPPIYLPNGTWQMGEEYSNGLFYTFYERNGVFYSCLCNANYSLANVVPESVINSEANQVI